MLCVCACSFLLIVLLLIVRVCVCGCVRACVCVNTSIIRYMACIILKISNEVLFFSDFFFSGTRLLVQYHIILMVSFHSTSQKWKGGF